MQVPGRLPPRASRDSRLALRRSVSLLAVRVEQAALYTTRYTGTMHIGAGVHRHHTLGTPRGRRPAAASSAVPATPAPPRCDRAVGPWALTCRLSLGRPPRPGLPSPFLFSFDSPDPSSFPALARRSDKRSDGARATWLLAALGPSESRERASNETRSLFQSLLLHSHERGPQASRALPVCPVAAFARFSGG